MKWGEKEGNQGAIYKEEEKGVYKGDKTNLRSGIQGHPGSTDHFIWRLRQIFSLGHLVVIVIFRQYHHLIVIDAMIIIITVKFKMKNAANKEKSATSPFFHPDHCVATIWRLEWIFSLNLGNRWPASLSTTSQSPSVNQTRRRVAAQIQIQIQSQIHRLQHGTNIPILPRSLCGWARY